jgi:hypothetical protein
MGESHYNRLALGGPYSPGVAAGAAAFAAYPAAKPSFGECGSPRVIVSAVAFQSSMKQSGNKTIV